MHQKINFLRITKGNNSNSLVPIPYCSILNVHLVDINVFAKLDEIPFLPFQDIKKRPKRRGRTDGMTDFFHIKLLNANVQCVCKVSDCFSKKLLYEFISLHTHYLYTNKIHFLWRGVHAEREGGRKGTGEGRREKGGGRREKRGREKMREAEGRKGEGEGRKGEGEGRKGGGRREIGTPCSPLLMDYKGQ